MTARSGDDVTLYKAGGLSSLTLETIRPWQRHHAYHRVGASPPPFDVGETLRACPEMVADSKYGARVATYAERLESGRIHVIFLEDLVRDPEPVLQGAYRFLGVDPDAPVPDKIPHRNPGTVKLEDTAALRKLLDRGGDSTVVRALAVIKQKERDELAVPLGLRRRQRGDLPGWDEDAQRRIAEQLADDALAFLAAHGKRPSLWPRLAHLASVQAS